VAIAFTADDFDVYFRSNCAGESVKFSVGRLLTDKLLLKLSECWFYSCRLSRKIIDLRIRTQSRCPSSVGRRRTFVLSCP
jgi:hypothetical protein